MPEHLTFVVAPASDGYNLGEESRYISLLQYIYGCDIKRRSLRLEAKAKESAGISKRKEGELWEQFVHRTTTDPKVDPDRKAVRPLSPSSLSKYVACPLRFYYEAICRYREEDSPSLLLASNEFGTVLHRVMEEFYSDLTKSPSTGDQLTFTTITKEMIDKKLRAKDNIRSACRRCLSCRTQAQAGHTTQRTLTHLLPDDRALRSRAPRVG